MPTGNDRINAEGAGEGLRDLHTLTHGELTELLASLGRGVHKVRLLEALLGHDLAEPVGKQCLSHVTSLVQDTP